MAELPLLFIQKQGILKQGKAEEMGSLGEARAKGSGNPVLIELNRLENLLKDKERELGAAQNEIKAFKGSEFLKEKAVVELSNELSKLEHKLGNAEKQIEDKNLVIKRLNGEKKAALSSQLAAESTLRRIYASQKDDDSVSAEALVAPLEAEVKMYKNEISTLREDRRALDRLMKSKETALVEIEKSLNGALERATMVENLQNQNLELKRQVEISQEENKYLEKTNRQKAAEVGKLTQTIRDLEECILAAGEAANAVRDYERQVAELNEERKMLERELAKAKVCANRVAAVVANEWKDEDERVMPVKQWLEERRFLQGEIQRLKDKLAISERSSRAETQLKDKIKLRLRTLEEGLKQKPISAATQITSSDQKFRFSSINLQSSQQRVSSAATSELSVIRSVDDSKTLKSSRNSQREKFISSKNVARKNLWALRCKAYDEGEKENIAKKINPADSSLQENDDSEPKTNDHVNESRNTESRVDCGEDTVSGFLYDRLQKEMIILRKLQEEKDEVLNAREDNIKLLQRKVDALTKAVEVEARNLRKAEAARETEVLQKPELTKQQNKTRNVNRRNLKHEISINSKT